MRRNHFYSRGRGMILPTLYLRYAAISDPSRLMSSTRLAFDSGRRRKRLGGAKAKRNFMGCVRVDDLMTRMSGCIGRVLWGLIEPIEVIPSASWARAGSGDHTVVVGPVRPVIARRR